MLIAICLKRISITPKPSKTAAGKPHLFLELSDFLERRSNNAGNTTTIAAILKALNSSLKKIQAPKIGINKDNRCAASVFTIPMCLIDAAKNRNMDGNKIPIAVYKFQGELILKSLRFGLKEK